MTASVLFPARTQRLLVAGIGAVMIAVVGRTVPVIPENIDPKVYHRLISLMRGGEGFYPALDQTFRAHRMGPVDSVLAVRSPVGFWFLSAVGSDLVAWIVFLVAATMAAWLLARVLDRPVYGVAVVLFFVLVGNVAWTAPELWASILVVAAVALALDDQWLPAAMVATVATSTRELAVLVLVGLVAASWRERRAAFAPLVGLLVVVVVYMTHWIQAKPYLARAGQGRQAELLGTGTFPGGVAAMMSTWIPGGMVVGPVLFVATLMWAHRRGRLELLVPVLALVLTGALVDRPEWATFIVPLTVPLGLDEIDHRIQLLRTSSPGRDSGPPRARIWPVSAGRPPTV